MAEAAEKAGLKDSGRIQLSEEPLADAGARYCGQRRDRRNRVLSRHPRRRLHGRCRNAVALQDGSRRRRWSGRRSRQPHHRDRASSVGPDQRGVRAPGDGDQTAARGTRQLPRMRTVESDDIAHAMVRFARGCLGTLEAAGHGTGTRCRSSSKWSARRVARLLAGTVQQLHLYTWSATTAATDSGPSSPDRTSAVRRLRPAPGHRLGLNDLKTIGMRDSCSRSRASPPRSGFPRGVGSPEGRRCDHPVLARKRSIS